MIKLSVKNTLDTSDISDIKIYATNFKLVYNSKGFVEDINVSGFAKGIYFIKITFNTYQVTKKIIFE